MSDLNEYMLDRLHGGNGGESLCREEAIVKDQSLNGLCMQPLGK